MKTKTLTLAALAAAISMAHEDEKIILTQFELSDTASDRGQVRVGAKFDGNATHLVKFTPLMCGRMREGMDDIRDNAWRYVMKRDGAPAEMLK